VLPWRDAKTVAIYLPACFSGNPGDSPGSRNAEGSGEPHVERLNDHKLSIHYFRGVSNSMRYKVRLYYFLVHKEVCLMEPAL